MYFSFNSGWYSNELGIVCKEHGWGGQLFLLNRQNLLSVTKAICLWYLNRFRHPQTPLCSPSSLLFMVFVVS